MIALIGESCSGKSTVQKALCSIGYDKVVTVTTRPKRPGEIDGEDYTFVTEEDFAIGIAKGRFAEYAEYKNWLYGTLKEDYSENGVVVLTPRGLRELKDQGINVVSFYIKVPRRDRLIRALQTRKDIEEIKRRDGSDVGQFDGVEDEVDFVIENDGYYKNPETIARFIDSVMNERT